MARYTSILLIVTTLALVVWDIWVASNDEPGDTISETILRWSQVWPILPFVTGLLMGHLFWPQR